MVCLFIGAAAASCGEGDVTLLGEGSYHVGAGYGRSFLLPGGGRVTLSPHTTITLAKGFNKDNRDIRVDGEAFFDLTGVTGAPFGVLTRDLKIAVGASRFRVDASTSRPGEEVDLLEGRLRAAKSYPSTMDNEPEVLESGEMVMVNRDVDLMEKEKLSPDEMARLRKKF